MFGCCLAYSRFQKERGFTGRFSLTTATMSCWSWHRSSDCSLPRIQPGDFLREQRIRRKLVSQRRQKFARMPIVVLAYIGNREQYVCKRRKIVTTVGNQLQFLDPSLLVAGKSAQSHQPAHR